ncbi:MAG TPA: hypothetical protein VFX63_18105 [Pyrinomonadaceae bacterium]|nr:hypothetical protein [Pyrinomonadaceae bacterium]
MNDDYLWDKTGQPDPQIQQLEEILGTLRYQPKPLALPQKRNYFPLLAIAASLLLALLAGGIWLRARSRNEAPPQQARVETPAPKPEEKPVETPKPPVNKSVVNPSPVVANNRRRNRPAPSTLPQRERDEALMAKEQLMLALRVTTEKLHLVHTKTQPNQIKNQHRVG